LRNSIKLAVNIGLDVKKRSNNLLRSTNTPPESASDVEKRGGYGYARLILIQHNCKDTSPMKTTTRSPSSAILGGYRL